MLARILVAASLGLSNFAAAIGIGISGCEHRNKLKVRIIFGLFETDLLGLELGTQIGARAGQQGASRRLGRSQRRDRSGPHIN